MPRFLKTLALTLSLSSCFVNDVAAKEKHHKEIHQKDTCTTTAASTGLFLSYAALASASQGSFFTSKVGSRQPSSGSISSISISSASAVSSTRQQSSVTVASPTGSSSPSSPSASSRVSASKSSSQSSSNASSTRATASGSASLTRPLASGSASSTRPSASGSASSVRRSNTASVSIPTIATCPPHSTTTQTYTSTKRITTSTTTSTQSGTITSYPYTVFTTSQLTYTYQVVCTAPTSTLYDTYTTTTTSQLPAAATVTIPTASGFTPVSCLPAYLDPTVTIVTTVGEVYTVYTFESVVLSTFTQPVYTFAATTISTYSPTTISHVTSVITITKAADPTKTVYDACAPNNIAFTGPYGSHLDIPTYLPGAQFALPTQVADATECCNLCQSEPACLLASGLVQTSSYNCILITRSGSNATSVCDPTFQAAKIPFEANSQGLGLSDVVISNSECGQFEIVRGPF